MSVSPIRALDAVTLCQLVPRQPFNLALLQFSWASKFFCMNDLAPVSVRGKLPSIHFFPEKKQAELDLIPALVK
jgi:hypothetical protein